MVKYSLKICHLYPLSMNIYGDTGNVITLQYRLSQRGISVDLVRCEAGETLPTDVDIVIAGGGQDKGQYVVEKDLLRRKKEITAMVENNVVFLTICGTYQLFGHRFITHKGDVIKGIGVFDLETQARPERLIGNIIIDTPYGKLVGFENHSGKTFLSDSQRYLGKVLKGAGNNGDTGEEGAILNNSFGTYLHGPILPKNSVFADELLLRALRRKYGDHVHLSELDDSIPERAAAIAMNRPR